MWKSAKQFVDSRDVKLWRGMKSCGTWHNELKNVGKFGNVADNDGIC